MPATHTRHRAIARLLLTSAAIALAATSLGAQATAAAGSGCARRTNCVEVSSFAAGVLEFRTSQSEPGTKIITTNMRFINKSTKPLILGYVQNSGVVTDDQGNRYTIYGNDAVRGMGQISGSTFDPKFVLQPGETSDARFEYTMRMSRANQILGTTYEIDLAVREIEPIAGNQFRLGKEHALHFRGFSNASVASSSPATPSPATPAPALPQEVDPCGTTPRCYGAGPFVAEVTNFTVTVQGNRHDHVMSINLKLRNLTTQPLILAYKTTTSIMTDNLGNRYVWGRPGTHDNSVTGIGRLEGSSADPQFVLGPGESRTATFGVWRQGDKVELGTTYSYDLTLTQLEILPSRQIRAVRDYAVTIKDLSAGSTGVQTTTNAGQQLIDALRKKIKP